MVITKHGYKRVTERVGLPKRAHLRHIKSVLMKGQLSSREGLKKFEMLYHGFLYIFALTAKLEPILLTTFRMEL
jgi:hypothetical protein